MRIVGVVAWVPLVLCLSWVHGENQCSYDYETEIIYNDKQGCALPKATEEVAKNVYDHLNSSILFDTKFVSKPWLVRGYNLQLRPFVPGCNGFTFKTITDDDIEIPGTLFDRGSNTLLVIGGGFTNERELMAPFLAMFPHYDILLFDYRGHGLRPFSIWDTESWPISFTRWAIGCHLRESTLGLDEHNDILAAVHFAKSRKAYKHVYGLGVCFSAFLFLKVAAMSPDIIFEKLVLDGCWESLPLFAEKIKADPKLIFDPQLGGCAKDSFYANPTVQDAMIWLLVNIFGLSLHNLTLLDYLPKLNPNLSLLFIHGKKDLVVAKDEFERVYNAANVNNKAAIITSNHHVRNHWKQKELYAEACNLFFEQSQEKFINLLQDPVALADYHKKQFADLLDKSIKRVALRQAQGEQGEDE